MPIRPETDTLSKVKNQKDLYFRRQDPTATNLDFNRFVFMKPGNKDKFYDWRMKFETLDLQFETFLISEEKYVNRPDAISYNVYGNSKYWWIIAMANDIKDPFFEFHKGRKLKIPDLQLFKREIGF